MLFKAFAQRITAYSLRRLIALFVIVSTLLLLITLACFYYSFYRASLKTSYEFMDNTLSDTGNRLSLRLDNVSSSMLNLAYSKKVYDKFVNASPVQKFETSTVIRTMLNNLADNDPLISNIVLLLKNGQSISSENESNYAGLYMMTKEIIKEYHLSEPFQHILFTHCYTELDTKNVYFACLVPVYNTVGGAQSADRYAGAYIALCAAQNLVDVQNSTSSSNQSTIVIAEKGSLVYSNDPGQASGLIQSFSENDKANEPISVGNTVYQIRMGTVKATGWNIICAVPDVKLRSGFNQIRNWGAILAVSIVLVQLLMGFTLRLSIVKPLSSIVKQIHNVGTEGSPASLTVPDSSEIGILAIDIKDMLERIEEMNTNMINATKAQYEAENDSMEAQIMFLQAQINPHFLYNNLECIRGMAVAGHVKAVRGMVNSMATVYRYCVSSGQIATLRDELDAIKQFFNIISLRYDQRYNMTIDVDNILLDRQIPKMTLQPILENAFLHGLVGVSSGGIVQIRGYIGSIGETVMTVCDNGHGMDIDDLTKLNQQLSQQGSIATKNKMAGIGIPNVNSRIRLIFGNNYGIQMQLVEPHGLCVVIRLGKQAKLIETVEKNV